MLQNAYLLPTTGFDTAENEPSKNLAKINFANLTIQLYKCKLCRAQAVAVVDFIFSSCFALIAVTAVFFKRASFVCRVRSYHAKNKFPATIAPNTV